MAQTYVFENGRWTSRHMDLSYILSQNRSRSSPQEPCAPARRDKVPVQGVMVRTLLHSSVVKWILPGRIRHDSQNDVILVREQSIEIQELVDDWHLRSALVKSDFGGRIRAARIAGTLPDIVVQPPADSREAILTQSLAPKVEAMDLDDPSTIMPSQMLVLSLQSGHSDSLIFLMCPRDSNGALKCIHHNRPLPSSEEYSRRLGHHLAIDPSSRALAVAAQEGSFLLCALKTMSEIRREALGNGDPREESFQPLREERRVHVDGAILRMAFLNPPINDSSTVILLLVVSINANIALQRYEWDSGTSLRMATAVWQRFPLPQGLRLPTLIIPLTISPGFVLVCEGDVAIYSDIMTSTEPPFIFPLQHNSSIEAEQDPGGLRKAPLWSAWARPIRRDGWSALNEHVFLAREDGLIRYMELSLGYSRKVLPGIHSDVGRLGVNIDHAFAILDSGRTAISTRNDQRGSFDLLATAGDMSDGGLFLFRPRQDGQLRQVIPNWSPVLDSAIVPGLYPPQTWSAAEINVPFRQFGSDQLWVCSGRGNRHGAIQQLRIGVGAAILAQAEVRPTIGAARMWALPDPRGIGVHLLISSLDESELEYLPLEGAEALAFSSDEDEQDEEALEANPALISWLDRNAPTLAAGYTASDLLVQVTDKAIRIGSLTTDTMDGPMIWSAPDNMIIAKASVDTFDASVLLAVRTSDSYMLHKLQCTAQDVQSRCLRFEVESPPNSFTLPGEPSFVLLQTVGDDQLGFIGSSTGQLLVLSFAGDSIEPLCEFGFREDFAVCESIAIIRRVPSGQITVLCGLRNGSISVLGLQRDGAGMTQLVPVEMIGMGTTAVNIIPIRASGLDARLPPSRAIAICSESMCRMTFENADGATSAGLTCIWLSDRKQNGLFQHEIKAIAQLDSYRSVGKASDHRIFAMDKDHAYVMTLNATQDEKAIPVRVNLGGTPTRILYSSRLRRLMVIFTETHAISDSSMANSIKHSARPRRYQFSKLAFIDPQDPLGRKAIGNVIGRSGERVLGFAEWSIKLGDDTWPVLLFGTIRKAKEPRLPSGNINVYAWKSTDDGDTLIKQLTCFSTPDPVYAVAAYDDNSIVYCTGTDLILRSLIKSDTDAPKWSAPIVTPLRSPARSISVQLPRVFVSSHRDSLVIYTTNDEGALKYESGDQQARNGLVHVVVGEASLVFASSRDCSVHALRLSSSDAESVDPTIECVFDLRLPSSITRLWRNRLGFTSSPDRASLIASATDGSLYQLDLLQEDEWRLLRYLQNIAENSRILCPHTFEHYRYRSLEPSTLHTTAMHVDGDLLERLLHHCQDHESTRGDDQTPQRALDALLHAELPAGSRNADLRHANERLARFHELAVAALGDQASADPTRSVLQFVRGLLQGQTRLNYCK